MPARNVQFANDEFYHVVKRGVEQRTIFLDDEDRFRFINSLLVFNDANPAPWSMRAFWSQRDPASLSHPLGTVDYKPKNPFVEIHAFALMDNHFHLLLRQIQENGISHFMNKLGGYSYYFNKKHKRVGPLFQGRFKAVLIRTDEQLKNTFVYVNTNPVGLIEPYWKEQGIKDLEKSLGFLREYKWSSCPDYMEGKDYYSFVNKNFFHELFGSYEYCKKEIESWLKYKVEVSKFKNIVLE